MLSPKTPDRNNDSDASSDDMLSPGTLAALANEFTSARKKAIKKGRRLKEQLKGTKNILAGILEGDPENKLIKSAMATIEQGAREHVGTPTRMLFSSPQRDKKQKGGEGGGGVSPTTSTLGDMSAGEGDNDLSTVEGILERLEIKDDAMLGAIMVLLQNMGKEKAKKQRIEKKLDAILTKQEVTFNAILTMLENVRQEQQAKLQAQSPSRWQRWKPVAYAVGGAVVGAFSTWAILRWRTQGTEVAGGDSHLPAGTLLNSMAGDAVVGGPSGSSLGVPTVGAAPAL